MKQRRPLEFSDQPVHYVRRERPHVAQEYRDNDQLEIAYDLARNLTPKAKAALGL